MKRKWAWTAVVLTALWIPGAAMAIEEPDFEVLWEAEDYEIRRYAPYILAEVEVEGDYRPAMNQGFRLLADYIFGGNEDSMRMEMTAPVFQQNTAEPNLPEAAQRPRGESSLHVIGFVMPGEFTRETLPSPRNDRVRLREHPGGDYAVMRFSGWASENQVRARKGRFAAALAKDGIAVEEAAPLLAQYNPPWTLPFLRRNELLVPLRAPFTPPSETPRAE